MGNKIIVGVFLILMSISSKAQSIPIQLMVVDQNGFEMPNTQVKLRLTMRGDTSLTTGQYQEVHNVSTNDLGIVSVNFGAGITTTKSQVLGLELFAFDESEPFIKTELDTSISPTQYRNLGWMRYNYPLIAQRALKADTANYLKNSVIYESNDAAAFNVASGITIPSLDSTAMNAINTPTSGQLIYNTNLNGLLIWSMGSWKPISVGQSANDDVKRVINSIILQ